jgi:uncharacterized protein with GYD domain
MLFAMIGRLTQESLRAFIENPSDRFGPASKMVEAAGGKLQQMYQTAEGYAILILDVPDIQSMTAIATSVQAINRLADIRIHRLQTTAEFAEGMRLGQKAMTVQQFPKQ